MKARTTILAACLLAPLCTGCTTAPGVVRGQSPAAPGPHPGYAGQYGGQALPSGQHLDPAYGPAGGPAAYGPPGGPAAYGPGGGPAAYGPPGGPPAYGPAGGPPAYGPPGGPDDGSGGLFGRGDWQPTHYHWYTYEAPKNLVYPPQNVPASVVSYPYYTCKGPDCFFKTH